jgi:hypothetical protein
MLSVFNFNSIYLHFIAEIPQYLHEEGYTRKGCIAVTQPRRVAAITIGTHRDKRRGENERRREGVEDNDCII